MIRSKILSRKILLLVAAIGLLKATPSPGSKVQHLMIGTNNSSFFTLTFKRTSPAYYGAFTDSMFFIQSSIEDASITSKVLLQVTAHRDSALTGKWVMKEEFRSQENITDLIAREQIEVLYPCNFLEWWHVSLSGSGILVKEKKGQNQVILTTPYFQKILSEVEYKQLKIVTFYSSKQAYFIVLESDGMCTSDGEGEQFVIPFQKRIVKPVFELRRR